MSLGGFSGGGVNNGKAVSGGDEREGVDKGISEFRIRGRGFFTKMPVPDFIKAR